MDDRSSILELEANAVPTRADVVILGSGVSGMTAAKTLAEQGARCVLVDYYDVPGGNHISRSIDGLEFDIGAIYFHTTDVQFQLFPALADACRPIRMKFTKLNQSGAVTHFPLDIRRDIGSAGLPLMGASVMEAYARRAFRRSPPNTEEYVRNRIGTWLYNQSGLASYTSRLFGIAPHDIDVAFARDRLGWLTRQSSLRHHVKRQFGFDHTIGAEKRAVAHAPGGFSAYYTKAIETLVDLGVDVRLGSAMTAITRSGSTTTLSTTDGDIAADHLVSTIPIPIAARLAGVEVPRLDYVRLLSLFVESPVPLADDAPIIYNFDAQGRWKRITVHSQFYSPETKRTGFTVEVPLAPRSMDPAAMADSPDAAFNDFAEHVTERGLARGPLKLLGSHVMDFSYPILDIGSGERRDLAITKLAEAGIHTMGRQGGFDYIPHSSIAVRKAQKGLAQAALV
ncbi:MAG: FAD-dependent oxidoreductase [Pseudomonadota bacterium]